MNTIIMFVKQCHARRGTILHTIKGCVCSSGRKHVYKAICACAVVIRVHLEKLAFTLALTYNPYSSPNLTPNPSLELNRRLLDEYPLQTNIMEKNIYCISSISFRPRIVFAPLSDLILALE